ncbi:MAG: transcription-repair coupling factor [Lachnospirales bacterium]
MSKKFLGMKKELEITPEFKKLMTLINDNKDVHIINSLETQKHHVTSTLEHECNRNTLIICSTDSEAQNSYEDMLYFSSKKVYLYPSKDILFYNADLKSTEIIERRYEILNTLINEENITIIISASSLLDRLMPVDLFEKYKIKLEVGKSIPLDELVEKLARMGYKSRSRVEYVGHFSKRGGIIDIFPTMEENAIRIEFWGDEIDSIRQLDSMCERSINKVDSITILPIKELLYSNKILKNAITNISSDYETSFKSFENKGLKEEANNLSFEYHSIIDELENKILHNDNILYDYFYNDKTNILDYLKKDTIIYIDEPSKIKSCCINLFKEFSDSVTNKILQGKLLSKSLDMVITPNNIDSKLSKFTRIYYSSLYTDYKLNDIPKIDFKCEYAPIIKNRFDILSNELQTFKDKNYTIIIFAGNKSSGTKLINELEKYNTTAHYVNNVFENLEANAIYVTHGSLTSGFSYPLSKVAYFGNREIFGKEKKKKKLYNKKNSKKIDSYSDLKVGDYVVHENYGIGIFSGIEKINYNGISKDFIIINYADDGTLNLPVTQLDRVEKYIGSEVGNIKIHKLGGKEWTKTKNSTKKAAAIVAKELIELYAKRQASTGFAFSTDTLWQTEFEEKFPYEETEDQINAINDVKNDMEQQKVMDRLICGDVGFGKTEVALRGAFKAVQDGKQVAYLVPTTILAQQHYNTFSERMLDYSIDVELMSRFRTQKEQKNTLKKLKSGQCDIVIGTHRILSKDVEFKDLGLVIVDEEQRFGVKHKEKLKNLRNNVDIMTLTATPIPRTLHMSLVGIKDMSTLEEPPKNRRSIQTFVMEYDESSIRDAINRELSRGGQIFFLHNRINSIEKITSDLHNLVPNATIAYAHGQMSIRELENIMKDFINNEINILVCTTIIETGLDITNANTIIVNNADNMGLSQLYQLRGRVGRSNKKAYAYLLYKKDKVITEVAEKRLEALKEFTAFGSGYKISMRDLEIRGSGSLLGEQQHGHINNVGYDLYCKLLDRAVKELQGEKGKEIVETKIDVNVSGYLPSYYIEDERQRIDIYKKIAYIDSLKEFYDMQEELEDRFGDLPNSVQNLLDIALIKCNFRKVDAISILEKKGSVYIAFKSDAQIDGQQLLAYIENNRHISFKNGTYPEMKYTYKGNLSLNKLKEVSEEVSKFILKI